MQGRGYTRTYKHQLCYMHILEGRDYIPYAQAAVTPWKKRLPHVLVLVVLHVLYIQLQKDVEGV